MKIKTRKSTYNEAMMKRKGKRLKPLHPSLALRSLIVALSFPTLKKTHFTLKKIEMEKLGKKEPALFLMNHSSFIDLKIASSILYPRPFNIICESDGFIGKEWLMRHIGCIPTHKFVSETALVKDMLYTVRKLRSSILLYPEASYSFDGTSPTPLPESLGKLVRLLGIPVVMIRTYGAFHRDPLYNHLNIRKVDVSAEMKYLLSPEDTKRLSAEEINSLLRSEFTFDHFDWQRKSRILVKEKNRAVGLSSVLYKCPCCGKEGVMDAKGTEIRCTSCGTIWTLKEDGALKCENGDSVFDSISQWAKWERVETEKEIDRGEYCIDVPVEIYFHCDYSSLYSIGKGRLIHSEEGFHLTSDDGEVDFYRYPLDNYTAASDLYWYEKGDMISLGDTEKVFFCFPLVKCDIALKVRMATEYIYRKAKSKETG